MLRFAAFETRQSLVMNSAVPGQARMPTPRIRWLVFGLPLRRMTRKQVDEYAL